MLVTNIMFLLQTQLLCFNSCKMLLLVIKASSTGIANRKRPQVYTCAEECYLIFEID